MGSSSGSGTITPPAAPPAGPTETTVKVTVKTVGFGCVGYDRVAAYTTARLEEIKVSGKSGDAGFAAKVKTALLAKIGSGSTTTVYRLFNDRNALQCDTVINDGSTVYVGELKAQLSNIEVKKYTGGLAGITAISKDYDGTAGNGPKLSIDLKAIEIIPSNQYVAIAKKELAKALVAAGESVNADAVVFFKNNTATPSQVGAEGDFAATIHAGTRAAITPKITLKLIGAPVTTAFAATPPHVLSGKKVAIPNGPGGIVGALPTTGKVVVASEAVYNADEVYRGLANQMLEFLDQNGVELGTAAGKAALFTASTPTTATHVADLTDASLMNTSGEVEVYLGLLTL